MAPTANTAARGGTPVTGSGGAVDRLKELSADPARIARQFRPRRAVAAMRTRSLLARPQARAEGVPLNPHDALRQNGFTVFRGLIPGEECSRLADRMKSEAGVEPGVEYTRVDATNKFASTRDVLFDPRVLDAVRSAIGAEARFLQVSDLHYLHDTAGWHRDSVHRSRDSSDAPDWSDGTFAVVKAILYLESDNAAMGIMCGSHLSPLEMDRDLVKSIEHRGGQLVIEPPADPNRSFNDVQKMIPLAWKAEAGDLLVFDERMYHAGRRVESGKVTGYRQAAKLTLSLVFGPDNHHSQRLYSYFRYARRELHYKDFAPEYRRALEEHGLILRAGLGDYYERCPEELRMAHLRHPETMDALVSQFGRSGR